MILMISDYHEKHVQYIEQLYILHTLYMIQYSPHFTRFLG